DPVDRGPPLRIPLVERRGILLQLIEVVAEVEQSFPCIAGADLAGINQAFAVVAVIADEKGPESNARPLGLGKAADHKFLAPDALDLDPPVAAPADVPALAVFADNALVALAASLLPEVLAFFGFVFRPTDPFRPAHRLPQQFFALFKRQSGQIVPVK